MSDTRPRTSPSRRPISAGRRTLMLPMFRNSLAARRKPLKKLVNMREALASPAYFAGLIGGPSWAAWRVLLIAIVGEALTEDERAVFKALTGRGSEPAKAACEAPVAIGGLS